MHLKKEGALLGRSSSYAGAEFHLVEVADLAAKNAAYNRAVRFWQQLWAEFCHARDQPCTKEGGLFTVLEKGEEVRHLRTVNMRLSESRTTS
jgi:hypothetical protein